MWIGMADIRNSCGSAVADSGMRDDKRWGARPAPPRRPPVSRADSNRNGPAARLRRRAEPEIGSMGGICTIRALRAFPDGNGDEPSRRPAGRRSPKSQLVALDVHHDGHIREAWPPVNHILCPVSETIRKRTDRAAGQDRRHSGTNRNPPPTEGFTTVANLPLLPIRHSQHKRRTEPFSSIDSESSSDSILRVEVGACAVSITDR